MLVSPSGQVESYASSLLEPNLDAWFNNLDESQVSISQQARNLITANPLESHMDQASPALLDSRFANIISCSSSPSSPSISQRSSGIIRPATVTPLVVISGGEADENMDISGESQPSSIKGRSERQQEGTVTVPRGKKRQRERPAIAPIDMAAVNQRHQNSLRNGLLSAGGQDQPLPSPTSNLNLDYPQPPHSAPLPNHGQSGMVQMGMPLETPDTPTVGSMPLHHPYEPMYEIYLPTHRDRTAFFELRLQQMQSVVCKTIAKAWIKVIEPKKQSYHPYKLGEAAKPAWWPAGSRHREPDHLFLPERKNLIIGLLRSPHTHISALQTATAEIPSRIIRPEKAALLMDVYAVAREEENMRYAGADVDTPMRLTVSTLEGWIPSAKNASSGSKPGSSTMEKSRSMGFNAAMNNAAIGSRKRPSPPAMNRSVSDGRKRQAVDSATAASEASQAQAAAGLAVDANSQWNWQQEHQRQSQGALTTPLRQGSHLSSSGLHASEPRPQAGYYLGGAERSEAPMSAQIPYANLYPLGSPFGLQKAQAQAQAQLGLRSQPHSVNPSPPLLQQHRGSLSTPFSFAPLPESNEDLQHQLHSSPDDMHSSSQDGGSSSALGLHGIGIDVSPQESYGSQSHSMSQQLNHHEHLMHRNISEMSADSSGDLSFDSAGYADSYLSSNGPRTPTPGRTPSPGPVRPFNNLGLNESGVSSSQEPREHGSFTGSVSSIPTNLGSKEELDRIQQQLDAFEWNQQGLVQHGTMA